jgi:flagellar basal body-associated protein FliL
MTQKRAITFVVSAFLLIAAAPGAKASGGESVDPSGAPIYVDFKSIAVPVIKKNGRSGVLSIALMAEVKDEKTRSVITQNMPRLRDAFIRALYGKIETNRYTREDGTLNIEDIKKNLMKTARFVMRKQEDAAIQDILFQNIAQHTF